MHNQCKNEDKENFLAAPVNCNQPQKPKYTRQAKTVAVKNRDLGWACSLPRGARVLSITTTRFILKCTNWPLLTGSQPLCHLPARTHIHTHIHYWKPFEYLSSNETVHRKALWAWNKTPMWRRKQSHRLHVLFYCAASNVLSALALFEKMDV